jgi:MFS family permease
MHNAIPTTGPDTSYSWIRLLGALLVGTVTSVGMWSVVVVLPAVQDEFGIARAEASLPYTLAMVGFGFGTILMGRVADRVGIIIPIIASALCLSLGFIAAGLAPNLLWFAIAHGVLIGVGTGSSFAPLMADVSFWFVKRRGLAVVVAACGSYLAGVIWPMVLKYSIPTVGWRYSYIAIGVFVIVSVLPMTLMFRRKLPHAAFAAADSAMMAARSSLGVSPRTLQVLLTVAGFACCVAMSMPQVHIVAYCGDLGYGVARGAEMLSLMMVLGIVSRIGSGFLADRIGGGKTLLLGSLMQGASLALYLFFDGLSSLYLISGIFGLFQGGIVPMYAVIVREFLPAREAGTRIGIIMTSTLFGMAFGGYFSGLIYDVFSSYRVAFLNGMLWNLLNLSIVGWLLLQRRSAPPKIAAQLPG